jgi:hypothetical protein
VKYVKLCFNFQKLFLDLPLMKIILDLSTSKLKKILAWKTQIERLQSKLASLAGGTSSAAPKGVRKRRKMSAAARKKISQAAKARWARVRAAKAK